MNKIVVVALAVLVCGCRLTDDSAWRRGQERASAHERAKDKERERAVAEQKKVEAQRDKMKAYEEAERIKADAEKKKVSEYAQAEKYKADMALKQACEDRKKAEAIRDSEINARFNALLDKYGNDVDIKSELAIGERFFNQMGQNRFDLKPSEFRIVGEYVYCLRLANAKRKLTTKQLEDVFVGAVEVGRANVMAWSHRQMSDSAKLMAANLVSSHDDFKRSVLLLALSGQDNETVRYIWQLHPRVDLCDKNGDVALHYAIRRGDTCDILMSLGTNLVNKAGKGMKTPLFTAIDFYRHDIIPELLKNGASLTATIQVPVNDPSKDGKAVVPMRPFSYACFRGDRVAMDKLMEYGDKPTVDDFRVAIVQDHLELVKWFVEKLHFNVNEPCLTDAAHKGTVVEGYLRERGAVNQNATR